MNSLFSRRAAGSAVFFLALATIGCDGGLGRVSGRVTYEGKALALGTVLFVGQDGRTWGGQIGTDGSYAIDGVPPGPVRITVALGHPGAPAGLLRPPGQKPPPPEEAPAPAVRIPERYRSPEKSGLTYTVTRGSQTHDIQLKP